MRELGRRLPTAFELQSTRNTQPVVDIDAGGEWSSTAYYDGTNYRAYVNDRVSISRPG